MPIRDLNIQKFKWDILTNIMALAGETKKDCRGIIVCLFGGFVPYR